MCLHAVNATHGAVVTRKDVELIVAKLQRSSNSSSNNTQNSKTESQDNESISYSASQTDGTTSQQQNNSDLSDVSVSSLVHVISSFNMPRWHYNPDARSLQRFRIPTTYILVV
jgi:NAD/NADP transhydrogenase alpha subunit